MAYLQKMPKKRVRYGREFWTGRQGYKNVILRKGGIMQSELELYIENQTGLVKRYNGKIIALHHGEVEGVYGSKLEAFRAMRTKYEPGDFMIIKCTPGNEQYTIFMRSPRRITRLPKSSVVLHT